MPEELKGNGNVREVVLFLGVSEMERSIRYYVDGLGFTIKYRWMFEGKLRWCWLTLGGAAIMLQESSQAHAGNVGKGVSLWFQCEDALAIYHRLRSRSIEASEPEVGNGMWVTSLSDPDGYRLHFESATEVPEDTKVSEVKS
jgi:lactoylglutathione lyase